MSVDESGRQKGAVVGQQDGEDVEQAHGSEAQSEEELKEYLSEALFPLIEFGIEELEKTRPPDPVSFLAHFLLRHNPKRK